MRKSIHGVDVSSEPGTLESQSHIFATHCCAQCAKHLALTHRPKTDWHQLRGITHCHNSESIFGMNEFPPGCLNLALACICYFGIGIHENMPAIYEIRFDDREKCVFACIYTQTYICNIYSNLCIRSRRTPM